MQKIMEELKISDLSDKELKEKIIKQNNYKLNNIIESSYLNAFAAIMSVSSVLDKTEEFTYLEDLRELEIFNAYFEDGIKLINQGEKGEEASKNLEKAKETRDEIYKLLKTVEGYYIELSYLGNIVDHHVLEIHSKTYEDNRNMDLALERAVKAVLDKLESYKMNYSMYNHTISQILQYLPMRLTKDKYIDIIENTLRRNYENLNPVQVEDKINNLKRQWDSSLQHGYGVKFAKCFALIEKLKKKDFKEKSMEELEDIVKEIIELTGNLNELYNFILVLGLIYNMIIAIYLKGGNDLEDELVELKKQWNNVLISKDQEDMISFMETNEKKMIEIEEKTIANDVEFEELNREAASRENFLDEELKSIYGHTKEILVYYNDYNLSNIDIVFNQDKAPIGKEYLDEWISSLTSYIKRSLKTMSSLERKIRMKKTLSLLELPFGSIREFEEYIRYSLNDNLGSSGQRAFIVDNILAFMDSLDKQEEVK